MATNKNPIFLNTIVNNALQFIDSDGTADKTVQLAGADGAAVTDLVGTSTDTADVIMVLSLNDGALSNIIGEITIPLGAGTDGATPPVNLLDAAILQNLQNDGSLLLGPAASLTIAPKAAVTATFTVFVTATGGSYTA